MPALNNLQHEKFCVEFLVDFNATQAAIRAGYSPGKDNNSARNQGTRLIANDAVAARIKELHEGTLSTTLVSVRIVLEELKRISQCDAGEAFNEDGSLKPIKQIPVDVRKCIAGFETDELFEGVGSDRVQVGVTKKVKFWDKNRGLEMIGRYLKMFTDKVEHNVELSLEKLVEADAKKNEVKT